MKRSFYCPWDFFFGRVYGGALGVHREARGGIPSMAGHRRSRNRRDMVCLLCIGCLDMHAMNRSQAALGTDNVVDGE